MLTGRELFIVLGVVLMYGAIRMLPRFMAGFRAYLSPAQVKQAMDADEPLLLLDVRTPAEFVDPGHVVGAINVPLPELKIRLERDGAFDENRDSLVVAICRTDARAAFATWILKRHGFTRPHVMSGGISAWIDDGLHITQDTMPGEGNTHT